MPGFRKVGEREIYKGHVISLGVGSFEAPDGTPFEREVVHHPGAVSIVAIDDEQRVTLVRQYRAALDDVILEIPAGKRDVAGEPPELTARRELEEEVGLRGGAFELLVEFQNSPGFCDEHSYIFLATGLESGEPSLDGIEEQYLVTEQTPLGDVPAMIADGRLRDAKTIIGLLLARERLGVR